MNLNETEKEIYGQLNVEEQTELQKMWHSTAQWQMLPKVAAAFIAASVLLAFIF